MTLVVILSRVLLAAALGAAAVAKALDVGWSRRALERFGTPKPLSPIVAVGLPIVELALAVGLLLASTAWAAAVASLVLLVAFSVVVGRAVVQGERIECHCFGALSEGPAGPGTLVRNGVLAALAVVIVASPADANTSIPWWLSQRSSADRVAWWLGLAVALLFVAGAWLAFQLLRQHGRLLVRLDALERERSLGLPVHAPAPAFALNGFAGGEVSLEGLLRAGRPVLLVFSDAGCGPCTAAVPLIADAQRRFAGRLTIALVSVGSTPASEAAWLEHGIENVGVSSSRDVHLSYAAAGTPAAVLVSADGRIQTRLVGGLGAVSELLADPVGDVALDAPAELELTMTGAAGGS